MCSYALLVTTSSIGLFNNFGIWIQNDCHYFSFSLREITGYLTNILILELHSIKGIILVFPSPSMSNRALKMWPSASRELVWSPPSCSPLSPVWIAKQLEDMQRKGNIMWGECAIWEQEERLSTLPQHPPIHVHLWRGGYNIWKERKLTLEIPAKRPSSLRNSPFLRQSKEKTLS